MLKFVLCWLCATLISSGIYSAVWAQTAVEYGIIGSKPPPNSSDIGTSISKKVNDGLKPTRSSNKGYTTERQRQMKPGGKNGEPLIIERRGDGYRRVN